MRRPFTFLISLMIFYFLYKRGYIGGNCGQCIDTDTSPDVEITVSPQRHPNHLGNKTGISLEEHLNTLLEPTFPEQERLVKAKKQGKQTKRVGYWNTEEQVLRDNNPPQNCQKRGQAIIKDISHKEYHFYFIWTETCKQVKQDIVSLGGREPENPKRDGSLEKGCSEIHSVAGFDVDDKSFPRTVVLPTSIIQIIKPMYEKYGTGCVDVYYDSVEYDLDFPRNSKSGMINIVFIAKQHPVVKLM